MLIINAEGLDAFHIGGLFNKRISRRSEGLIKSHAARCRTIAKLFGLRKQSRQIFAGDDDSRNAGCPLDGARQRIVEALRLRQGHRNITRAIGLKCDLEARRNR